MNWQVVTFFGDSTVLLPSAAVLFIVLFLRKDSKQLAWHWGAAVRHNRRNCLRIKTGIYGLGNRDSRAGLYWL